VIVILLLGNTYTNTKYKSHYYINNINYRYSDASSYSMATFVSSNKEPQYTKPKINIPKLSIPK